MGKGDMPQLGDAAQFIELSNRAACLEELDRLLDQVTHEMGFDYYALVQHVDVRRNQNCATIWLENYPGSWSEIFVNQGLYSSDPILMASERTSAGFIWSDVGQLVKLTAHHRRVLAQAEEEGMGDGYTVPAHIPGESNGTCNFAVRKGRDIPEDQLMLAQLVGTFAFEAGRKIVRKMKKAEISRPRLTPRQLDCLIYVARGKSDWEIGRILGIKETTVRDYIEEACTRYDVRRRVQLVMRALHDGQLSLKDALG